jgi:hypothetical protein
VPGAAPAPRDALTRFDREARAVLLASEAQARADGSAEVAVHHVLLGLLVVPSAVAWTLATKGLDEARLRDALDRRSGVPFPPGDGRVPLRPDLAAERVPFAQEVRALIAGSARVADARRRSGIGPVELGLAVVATRRVTTVGPALDDLGLDPDELARALG